jgi:hypothetical protein
VRYFAALVSIIALVIASAAVAATRDPRAEQLRLNARDGALARSVALTRRDLGSGWTPAPVPKEEGPACRSFAPDLSRFTITGKAHTMFADARGSSVQSVVEVYASKAQAAGDFLAGAKPAQTGCLREALVHARSEVPAGVTLRFVSARMLPAPRVGERAASYRLVGRLESRGISFPLYMDLLLLQRGRTLAALFSTGLQRPVASQIALAQKLAARMR